MLTCVEPSWFVQADFCPGYLETSSESAYLWLLTVLICRDKEVCSDGL